jgi:hypothetical protein
MNIEYIRPFNRAWGRMKKALFQPFDLRKWFVVGFAAFLSQLTDWPHGGGCGGDHGRFENFKDILDFPRIAWQWMLDHPGWFTLIVFGLFVIIVVAILLTWLSSRGKFMFLDNVVHNRDRVTQPWHEFRGLGNSLFVWRLCFGVICLVVFLGFVILCYSTLIDLSESDFPTRMTVVSVGGMILAAIVLILIAAYVSLFLDDFVIPIMYKHNMTVTPAWGHFFSLFSSHWSYFLFYGIIILFIYLLFVVGVVVLGLLTCCVGFVLLMIPYIGSVITLPISYTLRGFSLEFLAQFGPEFRVFPESGPVSGNAPIA